LLILVAQGIITTELLPICEETLWINDINRGCMYFTFAALVVSFVIGTLYARLENKEASHKRRNAKASQTENETLRHSCDMEISYNEAKEKNGSGEDEADEKIRLNFEIATSYKILSYQKTRLLDKVLLVFCIVSYTVYLIIMFSMIHLFDDDKNKIWVY